MSTKIVVIGLGSMGRRRIRLMKLMGVDVELAGVDSNAERCKTVSDEYGIETYGSIDAACDGVKYNCAFVCASPLAHAAIIKECLERDMHIFTEINLVRDGYEENISLAKRKEKLLFMSSTPLYNEQMIELTRVIHEDGQPMNYRYHVGQYLPDWHPWESYSSFFIGNRKTNGCREILAIELPWIVRAFGPVKSISAISNRLTTLNIDYDDSYSIHVIHENGSIGSIDVDVVCRHAVRQLEVYNEKMYIDWDGTSEGLRIWNCDTGKMDPLAVNDSLNENGYDALINELDYVNEIKEFFEVLSGKAAHYTMMDDEKILQLIDEIENVEER